LLGIGDHGVHERALVAEMTRRDGRVTLMTEPTLVQCRDIGSDQLAFPATQRVRRMEEKVGERADCRRHLGTECEQRTDAGNAGRKRDVCHKADCT
jgi:hypothetical protein